MAILWAGGEDSSFPNGAAPVSNTGGGLFRPTFARCGLNHPASAAYVGKTFSGVTSAWISFQVYVSVQVGTNYYMGLAGPSNKGFYVVNAGGRAAIYKWDGASGTSLAIEPSATSLSLGLHRVDMQIENYGATGTVRLYLEGSSTALLTYSGDIRITGVTSLDRVVSGYGGTAGAIYSEIFAADENTTKLPGLKTLALTSAGTTSQWTGTYGQINQVAMSDATPNYTNTTAQDQQFNVTDLPGVYAIKAVKVEARAAKSATPTPTKIALGYNIGGSVSAGTDQAITTSYTTYERLDNVNPLTSAAWTDGEINALQLNARSAA